MRGDEVGDGAVPMGNPRRARLKASMVLCCLPTDVTHSSWSWIPQLEAVQVWCDTETVIRSAHDDVLAALG
jgi:hypothetical protein